MLGISLRHDRTNPVRQPDDFNTQVSLIHLASLQQKVFFDWLYIFGWIL